MTRFLYSIGLALLIAACSNNPDEPSRPGGEKHDEPIATDLSAELSNPAQRFVMPDTTVAYDNCGVIFGSTSDSTIFAVDITSGWRADYNAIAGTLKVNGVSLPIQNHYIAKREGAVTWHVAAPTSSPTTRIIIVTQY